MSIHFASLSPHLSQNGGMPKPQKAPARRPRGRPPKSDGRATAQRLLEAATSVCVERGFDGTTLPLIAERARVSTTAVYNHFHSREELLYAAAVRALDQITAVALQTGRGERTLHAIAMAYLRPEMRQNRRLIAELHLASRRDARLASLIAQWHKEYAGQFVGMLSGTDANPKATTKVVFLLLLGLCHFDDVPAIRTSRNAVAERVDRLIDALVPGVSR
jgi:AcrR family transcriptional regulator